MPTTIKLKNSVTTTNAPSSLVQGEVAINITDKKVWVGNAASTPVQLLGDGGSASFTSIAFGAGTVSNPSITFTGDTNTGIYSPAADTIAFTEGGVESMRIDSSGNVGIGTSSPGGDATNRAVTASGSGSASFNSVCGSVTTNYASTTGNGLLGTATNHALVLQTNNTERMRIENGGDIGIGTTVAVNGARISIAKGSAITTDPFIGGAITMSLQNTSNTAGNSTSIENFDSGGRGNSYIRFINIDQNYAGAIAFGTATTGASNFGERMRISNTGLVSIGASSTVPAGSAALVSLVGSRSAGASCMQQFTYNGGTFGGSLIGSTDQGGGFQIYTFTGNVGSESYSERMRITSAGDLLVGTTTASAKLTVNGSVYAQNFGNGGTAFQLNDNTGTAVNQFIDVSLAKAGGAYNYMKFAFNNIDILSWGGPLSSYSDILTLNSPQSAIVFKSANTERMRITSGGDVLVGKTSAGVANAGAELLSVGLARFTVNNGTPVEVNRLGNDGDLIDFYQATVKEGSISVSGTTVSYNGGHLARWSQLPSNQKDDTLLKGTVMSNLDDMCVWVKDGETLPNEQLNKMKVSDVEGDTNVAGVFVNWTFDEQCQSDDMNIAMTGDMIIRIAQGVVVQKGDLLMSAGDGTAKPQGDDIVRSKTIAKVTSNHITCTYQDGSYCVPCVLMAC